jgi:hypothetical protein
MILIRQRHHVLNRTWDPPSLAKCDGMVWTKSASKVGPVRPAAVLQLMPCNIGHAMTRRETSYNVPCYGQGRTRGTACCRHQRGPTSQHAHCICVHQGRLQTPSSSMAHEQSTTDVK